ncbi:MAG: hypothetical protein KR126chlam3_00608 [Chlamydiae bacterium]|nr:hypothetical protein [Chlamydiota bacterium]
MIQAISPSFVPANEKLVSQQPFQLSKAKVERVALFCFAMLSLFLGYSSFSVGTPIATVFAIACFTICGAILWTLSRSKDYENPQELQGYRTEALGFAEMREKHGLENMIKYEIPRAREFTNNFRVEVSNYSINSLIRLYEELQAKIEKYQSSIQLPHPSEFKDKFGKEIIGMDFCAVIEKYDIQKLYDYGIVTHKLYAAATDYFTYKKNWEMSVNNVKEAFKGKLRDAVANFQHVLDSSNGSTPPQAGRIGVWKSEAAFLETAEPDAWFSSSFEILKETPLGSLEIEESFQSLSDAQAAFIIAVGAAKETRDDSLKTLDRVLQQKKEKSQEQFHQNDFFLAE